MDSDLHSSSDRDDVKLPPFAASGHRLSRVTSAPEPRPADELLLPSFEQNPRKRDSPMHRSYSRFGDIISPSAKHSWHSGSSSPRGEMGEPPDKRPRLDHVPEKVEGARDAPKRRIDSYSNHYTYPDERLPPPPPPPPPSYQGDNDMSRPSLGVCGNSAETTFLVSELVSGFQELHAEISQVLAGPTSHPGAFEAIGTEITRLSLKQSLVWAITELRNTTRVVQGYSAGRPGLPSLTDVVGPPVVNQIRRLSIHGQPSTATSPINDLRPMPLHLDPLRAEDFRRRSADHPVDQMSRSFEHPLPSLLRGEEFKRMHPHEQPMPGGAGQSPHPSSASSIFGSALSPMQSQPSSRTLPSPPGAHYPRTGSSGSVQYSPTTTQSAHNSHLQDLQHQISTKTLALQTLQREHDQLLAAFSRSQVRCTALDKKSQVSDHEIITLTEDKIRLQQQVETLDAQVEDLVKARDEVTHQSTADGAQWRQIMAMSSQLQMKGADEARRFKAERESWDRERMALQRQIDEVETGKAILSETKAMSGSTTPVANDSILTSGSVEVLSAEIVRLRRRCTELELMLHELAGEAAQVENAISTMESVRRTLSRKRRSDDS